MAIIPTLEDTAIIKVVVDILYHPDIKKEIFCLPSSVFLENCRKNFTLWNSENQWNERIEKKASIILKNLRVPTNLQEKVLNFLIPIAIRIVIWSKYHERKFNLSSSYIMNCSLSSHYLSNGIIDDIKAANMLMKDTKLDIPKRFKLACHYCLTEHIFSLYRQLPKKCRMKYFDRESPQNIKQAGLVKFWSYVVEDEIDKLRGEKDLHYSGLSRAIQCGSKAAVDYFWRNLSVNRRKDVVLDAALETLRRSVCGGKYWVPQKYYIDILFFLFSHMEEDRQREFLRRDIETSGRVTILEHSLQWPYQENFMKIVQLIWEILPENNYAELMLMIADMIGKQENSFYWKGGEEKCYDYRTLLKEFWCESPDFFKRFHLRLDDELRDIGMVNIGMELLFHMSLLTNFTFKDKENMEIILSTYSNEEKENIINSSRGNDICLTLAEKERWGILEMLAKNCFASEEKIKEFKNRFCFSVNGKYICTRFVEDEKYDSADSFLKWSSLVQEEIILLKEEMFPKESIESCLLRLVLHEKRIEDAEKIVTWYFSSKEKACTFKCKLLFSKSSMNKCTKLILHNILKGMEHIKKVIEWSTNSCESKSREFKKTFAYRKGNCICKSLLVECKWHQVDAFLTWCLSYQQEMNDFKNKVLIKESGLIIHFSLISTNRWREAEKFFTWSGLSEPDIRDLKKQTLFKLEPARTMLEDLILTDKRSEIFLEYGGKLKRVQTFLRWYLTDKEAVLKFKDDFEHPYRDGIRSKAVVKEFHLAIEQRLEDLNEEQDGLRKGLKRKSEIYNLRKRSKILKSTE